MASVDTIWLVSPYVPDEVAIKIQNQSTWKYAVDKKTGTIQYEIVTGSMEGSYDSRISVDINRLHWIYDFRTEKAVQVSCNPWILIKCSLPKILIGNNVLQIANDFNDQVQVILNIVSKFYGVKLPDYTNWKVKEIHYSENFIMESKQEAKEWIMNLQAVTYPRRDFDKHKDNGIYFATRSTTFKIYHKGDDFRKHDKSRLKKRLDIMQVIDLEELADKIIRVEVEIHKRKLVDDFKELTYNINKRMNNTDIRYPYNDLPFLFMINEMYLNEMFDNEIRKVFKIAEGDMKMYNKYDVVAQRLYGMYETSLANSLLNFWSMASVKGDKNIKTMFKESTYYKYKKKLKNAGITWIGSDLKIDGKVNNVLFIPLLSSDRAQEKLWININNLLVG